ncbi:MAG: UDP-N-acetylmuramate dehydrogenase [Deltaproteobacteria bacterium]|nr:UDP-N-acetylmuramate dehydrogenase [Deltaproteobacteria bacterium]MCB9787856.1 UDP-N-acetylmuramate dehydrogenase [Deltaproteobacteria bacterium]
MNATLQQQLASTPGLRARFDEPMAAHTTYKVGGPAAAFVEVHSPDALVRLLALLAAAAVPWLVLGNGSNALFADRGYSGAVLHLGQGFDHVAVARDAGGPGTHRLSAGAALSVTRLLRFVKDEQLSGVEFLGGIPGTVGGAVRMNAGTAAGEVSATLEAAELTNAGGASWVPAAALGLRYRHSELPEGSVVTAARFAVRDADPDMRQRLDAVLAYRKATQPLQAPSCGSVFANPPGDHAGRLIEAAGLKGHTVGGAQVSEQHANWIINRGGASAADVHALIALCRRTVFERFGVELHHEVQLLGDWEVTA